MKKPVYQKKSTQSTKKKVSKTTKKTKKRSKNGSSGILQAFQLAGLLIVISAIVSIAVILVHSSRSEPPEDFGTESEILPHVITEPVPEENRLYIEETPKPVASVSVQPPQRQTTPPARQPANTAAPPASGTPPAVVTPAALPQRPPERPAENQGTLVFVIDDAGNNLQELDPFLRIPSPITIAVLPGLPHSAEAARRIRAAGKEVILHQPMEALGGQYPGPGAIYSGMSADEIRAILKRNVAEVGPVAGMNNHQGSKITMDREAMETILAFCAEQGLYFLDSRTTAETVTPAAARSLGLTIAERDVFIDNEQNREAMLRYITGGLTRAQRNGKAVMIGHTWSPELAPLLAEQFPLFIEQGYTIKAASDIIKAE